MKLLKINTCKSYQVTLTASITTTSTTTTTTTVSATQTLAPKYPICNSPDNPNRGAGGCSGGCYCDAYANTAPGTGSCTTFGTGTDTLCGDSCSRNADCPDNQFCDTGNFVVSGCGGPMCVNYSACTSSFNPVARKKRDAYGGHDVEAMAMVERDTSPRRVYNLETGTWYP